MKIDIRYDDNQVQERLDNLLKTGADLSPIMRIVAGHLTDSVAESFDRQSSPAGTPWQQLNDTTISERAEMGYVPVNILQRQGNLANSILADWDKASAVAGTNLVYATTHQFGARRGEFGKGAPWGDIPARPFLGIWPEHRDAIYQDVLAFLSDAWKP